MIPSANSFRWTPAVRDFARGAIAHDLRIALEAVESDGPDDAKVAHAHIMTALPLAYAWVMHQDDPR